MSNLDAGRLILRNVSSSIPFEALEGSDLIIDCLYRGGARGNAADDPIGRLLPVGNQGGFRYSKPGGRLRILALYTSGENIDWPDFLDQASGLFMYYGDNKTPGRALHDTQRGGNAILRDLFASLHSIPPRRHEIPPIFVFEKAGVGRSVIFRGLAVPGHPNQGSREDLVAVWKTTGKERFQNYRAVFSVLDSPVITRKWIHDIVRGKCETEHAPPAWMEWRTSGSYKVLRAEATHIIRTKKEQLPETAEDIAMVEATVAHFGDHPYAFELCAAELWNMVAPNVSKIDVTRPSRDGGRDAVGLYSVARVKDPLFIDFALEAKCYAMSHGVSVKDTSRLISRLKHRQFGVLVTTSYVAQQAYEEIREDGHPVVIMTGRDIVDTVKQHEIQSASAMQRWLQHRFPT